MSRCRALFAGLLLALLVLPVSSAGAKTLSLGTRDLRPGMHGHDVRVLQGFLTQVGVNTSVDGQYGPLTARHVRTWKRKSSMRVNSNMIADGFDPLDLRRLDDVHFAVAPHDQRFSRCGRARRSRDADERA